MLVFVVRVGVGARSRSAASNPYDCFFFGFFFAMAVHPFLLRRFFHNPNLFFRQTVQLIDEFVNLSVRARVRAFSTSSSWSLLETPLLHDT